MKLIDISPYAYCNGDPVNFVDPDGKDIYRYDDKSGEVILVEENDDGFDQVGIFKYDRKTGEYTISTKKDGTARTRIDHIEKGILNKNGTNFFIDTCIDLYGENRPSIEGVQQFLLDFSNMIDKEVGGYYVFEIGMEAIRYVTIGKVQNNTADKAFPGSPYNALKNIPGFNIDNYNIILNYHTHLSRFSGYDRLRPSSLGQNDGDIGFKNRLLSKFPTMKFMIITDPTPFLY